MKEAEMKIVANLISDVLLKRKSLKKVRILIAEMKEYFQKIRYCFE